MSGSEEAHKLRGPIDRAALIAIRDVINEEEPLASAKLDDFLNPTTLEVTLEDGLCGADKARFDIQWTTRDDYKFHYTDSAGIDFRWGRHPHDEDYVDVSGIEHYHPPPDASSDPTEVEESCITHSSEVLVTRAVLTLWRVAYYEGSLDPLNDGSNPP
jgi:hypothetical protein